MQRAWNALIHVRAAVVGTHVCVMQLHVRSVIARVWQRVNVCVWTYCAFPWRILLLPFREYLCIYTHTYRIALSTIFISKLHIWSYTNANNVISYKWIYNIFLNFFFSYFFREKGREREREREREKEKIKTDIAKIRKLLPEKRRYLAFNIFKYSTIASILIWL